MVTDLLDQLSDALTPSAIAGFGAELGLDTDDARSVANAVLPRLIEGLKKNASAGDADAIARAVGSDHDGELLSSAASFLGGGFRKGPGLAILGHVFGDELDEVIGSVARETSIPEPVISMAFSALAPLVMAALAKVAIGAITAVVVVKLLDVAVDSVQSGQAQEIVRSISQRLDSDHDGKAVDDVARTAKAVGQKGYRGGRRGARSFVGNKRVRSAAASSRRLAGRGARSGAKQAKRGAKKVAKSTVKAASKRLSRWFG